MESAIEIADRRGWRRQRWGAVIAGFALAFGAGMVYASWLMSFGDWNYGFAWERSLLLWTHQDIPRWLDVVLVIAPWFGTNIVLIPIVFVIGMVLWLKYDKRPLAMRLFVVQLGSFLLNPALKALFDRTRPELFERRGWYGWSAYPSGHAICSVAVLITIAIMLHEERGWRWPYFVIVPISLLSIYSRLYLGVHWPTDVFAGVLVGTVWLIVTALAFKKPRVPMGGERSTHSIV